MANVARVGASDNGGARSWEEVSDRRHSVTAIVRNPGKVPALPGATAKHGDVTDE